MSSFSAAPILHFVLASHEPAPVAAAYDWRCDDTAVDRVATIESAHRLCSAISERTGMTHEEALDGLRSMPDNVLPLLDTREGWVLLSEQVALLSGIPSAWVSPTQH